MGWPWLKWNEAYHKHKRHAKAHVWWRQHGRDLAVTTHVVRLVSAVALQHRYLVRACHVWVSQQSAARTWL